jgi:hypothetical protein
MKHAAELYSFCIVLKQISSRRGSVVNFLSTEFGNVVLSFKWKTPRKIIYLRDAENVCWGRRLPRGPKARIYCGGGVGAKSVWDLLYSACQQEQRGKAEETANGLGKLDTIKLTSQPHNAGGTVYNQRWLPTLLLCTQT